MTTSAFEDATPAVSVGLLGATELAVGGRTVAPGSPGQTAILAMLALSPGAFVPVQTIVDGLYGDDLPDGPQRVVASHVYRLRKSLQPRRGRGEPSLLEHRPRTGYRLLAGRADVDALAFADAVSAASTAADTGTDADPGKAARTLSEAVRTLSGALALWRGEALAGIPGPFAETARGSLAGQREAATARYLELLVAAGREHEAIPGLVRALDHDPHQERLVAALMSAYHRVGRTADALAAYGRARHALAEDLGLEPGPALRERHAEILSGAPDPASARQAAETVPGGGSVTVTARGAVLGEADESRRPVCADLPAVLPDFTGRRRERAGIVAALTEDPARPVVINGMGGVGKTSLAIRAAHEVKGLFPGGQLYIDLRGADGRPVDPGEALDQFLRRLGVPEADIPGSLDNRAALYRTLLAERPMLVLLDNVRDHAHAEALLPGTPHCATLLTSRALMPELAGAHRVGLDVLDEDDAVALLTRIIGAERARSEPEPVRELAALCGQLPLAVRVVAARLATRPGWSVASFAGRLDDEQHRLRRLRTGDLDVRASFELSYRQLLPEQARALRLLAAVAPQPVSSAVAAAVLDRPPIEAEDLCEALVDVGLMNSTGEWEYRFHDLLRLYGRELAEDAERVPALLRLLEFYLVTLRNTHPVISPADRVPRLVSPTGTAGREFADRRRAVAWFHEEQGDVFDAVERASREPGIPIALPADVLMAIYPAAFNNVRTDRLESSARELGRAAAERGDPAAEGRALYLEGGAMSRRFLVDEALPRTGRAVDLLRGTGDDGMLPYVLNHLGGEQLTARDFPGALASLDEAVRISRSTANPACESFALALRGVALLANGRPQEAVAEGEKALALAHDINDLGARARALIYLGGIRLWTGRPAEALEGFHESVRILRVIGGRYWESLASSWLARAYNVVGDFESARAHAEDACAVASTEGDDYFHARGLAELGRALHELGEPGRARACLSEAHRVFTALSLPDTSDTAALLAPLGGPDDPEPQGRADYLKPLERADAPEPQRNADALETLGSADAPETRGDADGSRVAVSGGDRDGTGDMRASTPGARSATR
ncbi:AfsR/SARP family transcriptional regulator [Actinomadura oligospora]|uniref:AfsR/SARP family transcriptional regulator n=1 Tax=Actinomadura oligospora TaxID=111804 RepID=UPI00047CD942|nr:BTAD domain-containing putative transcriptional regulator [Actinomadura oligospora]